MAKHRLIISPKANEFYPVRSDAGQLKAIRTLVVQWKGAWAAEDHPEQYLVVAPGDELEFELASDQRQGGSLWLLKQERVLLLPATETQRQGSSERVDLKSGLKVLQINRALTPDAGEKRYDLRISKLGVLPIPVTMQGQPGSLTAIRP